MRQGFQRPSARAGDRLGTAAVVDQSVDRFLQHTFFVLDDDRRSSQLQQLLQTIVPGDDTAVQIVQIGGREAAVNPAE